MEDEVRIVHVPEQYSGALRVAWERSYRLIPDLPLWMREALKPQIVAIYSQGLTDGYETRIREEKRHERQSKQRRRRN